MARRKKSPGSVPVESIVWNDAYFQVRQKLDVTPVLQHTVGFLVHEDDTQVALAHEVTSTEDWLEEEMDYTKIPKPMIISRQRLAEVAIVREGEERVDVAEESSVASEV